MDTEKVESSMLSIIKWFQRIIDSIEKKDNHIQTVTDQKLLKDSLSTAVHGENNLVSATNESQNLAEQPELTFDDLVDSFLRQFDYNPGEECPFIYHEGNLQTFQCILSVSQLAKQHYCIDNLFPDDDTRVYFTTIPRDNPALIAFMEFMLKKNMCIRSFSICGSDGNAVLEEIIGRGPPKRKSYIMEAEIFRDHALKYPFKDPFNTSIKKLYEFSYLISYDQDKTQYSRVNAEFNMDIYGELCKMLSLNAGESIRWKNEFSLYNLVKKHFENAIYQFRAPWLGAQSLDIYIPELRMGIEYQGIQHYKSVGLFGGEEQFQVRQINDQYKREKCKDNDVMLLEWPYTDEVSEGNLKQKLKERGLQLPKATSFTATNLENMAENDCMIDNVVLFLRSSLSNDNLAFNLYYIKVKAKENDQAAIRKALLNSITYFTEHKALIFLKIILQYDIPAIYQAICSDDRLLDYWTKTGILNFYGRKIVFTLINEAPESFRAAKYLKKMRCKEKKMGINPDTRFINNLIRSEAKDNGISEERVNEILRKSY